MEIKQLETKDTKAFCDLIIDMYSNLENLEWFSPMPFDYENVSEMINNSRFFIIGAFENNKLCGVASIDYKCGKLIGKIDFPTNCNTDKLVEFGFTMVHSQCRGKGLMQQMLNFLMLKAKNNGVEWVFGKVHQNNLASLKSFIKCGFSFLCNFSKSIKVKDFVDLSYQSFFCQIGKINAQNTLANIDLNSEKFYVNYEILIKKL